MYTTIYIFVEHPIYILTLEYFYLMRVQRNYYNINVVYTLYSNENFVRNGHFFKLSLLSINQK